MTPQIKKGDVVLHLLSRLYFVCENEKHVRWMNENKYYQVASPDAVPASYFYKDIGKQH